jgi:PAS domain-containing protein
MLKLTVVSGPNRGSSYPLQNGENSIGRQPGNAVVVQSSKVSKKHCVLVVDNSEVIVKDAGSSNGTFVNGVLTKLRKVKIGDRISVGEYVFEIVEPQARVQKVAPVAGLGKVLHFPTTPGAAGGMPGMGMPGAMPGQGTTNPVPPAPKNLKERAIHLFETQLMPKFYTLNLKHEWRMICLGAFGALTVGNLVLSVAPILQSSRDTIIKETEKRASFMARQIAERNAPLLAAKQETKSEVGSVATADGVRLAALVDMDSRILAPPERLNQYLTGGDEATMVVAARDKFRAGRETGISTELDDSTVIAIEPVKIMSSAAGKNVVAGMAVVSVDSSLATPDLGEMGVIYSETLVLTGVLGGLILLILYKVTLKPFHTLNEDMDKVLKGDLPQVTKEFKFEELDSLWDIINSALQRVPKGGGGGGGGGSADSGGGASSDEYAGPVKMIGNFAKFGMLVLDQQKKILFLNPMFEELSGIRSDGAIGQDVGAVARDSSLAQFTNDLCERAPVGGEGVSDDYDFSGIGCKVHVGAFGHPGTTARCFVVAVVKNE